MMESDIKNEFAIIKDDIKSILGAIYDFADSVENRFNLVDNRLARLEAGQEKIWLRLDYAPYRYELKELEKRMDRFEEATGK